MGQISREPWNFAKAGEPIYDGIISQINLRYRLLSHTYSLAAMAAKQDVIKMEISLDR